MYTSIKKLDQVIVANLHALHRPALRLSLALIFIWFGILKPLGLSPAQDLVIATVKWLPFGSDKFWLHSIGWVEVLIGISFLIPALTRFAIAILAFQLMGTFLPLFLLPEITFQNGHFPYALTVEGQYIVKNLLIISAAMVLGGSLYRKDS